MEVLFENHEDKKLFEQLVGDETGTVILIRKIDKMSNKNPQQVKNILMKLHSTILFPKQKN